MKNNKNKNWLIILLLSIIVSFILWNTYVFVQNFKTGGKKQDGVVIGNTRAY